MNRREKNGFTLIEILAVIIILGVIMLIAVPSVSEYILGSRKDTYVSTIKGYVNGLKYKVSNFEYSFNRTDTTYYVHINNIPLDKGGDSPYGDWVDAYVIVTYDGKVQNYYWTSVDSAGYRVNLKRADEITKDDIVLSDNKFIQVKIPVGEREKIQIYDENGDFSKIDLSIE